MTGYLHVYTGEGKGKTTAALGLAMRVAGAGQKVFLAQFAKRGRYSELNALEKFEDLISVKQYGQGRFINGKPSESDINTAREGLEKMRMILSSGEYKLVIMDEANIALHYNLFSLQELLELTDCRAAETDLLLTGRHAHPEIIEKADLVIEMKAIKHYYNEGVKARVGIEK